MARAKRALVTLDVKELCDELSLAINDAERSDFVLGLQAGIRGTDGREDGSQHFRSGFGIGKAALYRKMKTSEKCTIAGKRGYQRWQENKNASPKGDTQGCYPMVHPGVLPNGEDTFSPKGDTDGCTPKGDTQGCYPGPIGTAETMEKKPFQGAAHSALGTDPNTSEPGRENPSALEKEEAAAPANGGHQVKTRKPRLSSDDIAPENAKYLQDVYRSVPKDHPITGGSVHKGSYAQAARAFQAIIDTGEATAQELHAVGKLYYCMEWKFPEWRGRVLEAWDYRDKAMMHVSTLYGPEKRAYQQLLPVARDLIAAVEAKKNAPEPQEAPIAPKGITEPVVMTTDAASQTFTEALAKIKAEHDAKNAAKVAEEAALKAQKEAEEEETLKRVRANRARAKEAGTPEPDTQEPTEPEGDPFPSDDCQPLTGWESLEEGA